MPFTKIVATLGPATTDPPVLADLLAAGVDVVRINCSHGVIGDHVAEVGLVHRVAKEVGRRVAVVADLQGPKMRVGSIPGAGVELDRGDEICVRSGVETAPDGVIPCVYPHLADDVRAHLGADTARGAAARSRWANLAYAGEPVRLVHLVNHTSGLPVHSVEFPTGAPPDTIVAREAGNTDAALLACTATQIAEIQQYIDNTCDGGGRVWVYCSWTGLWETRSAVECYD